jgi:hypothetical protein
MPIKVACKCGQSFAAKDELAGKQVKCPKCGQPLVIPKPQAQKPAGGAGQARQGGARSAPAAPVSGGLADLFDEAGIGAPQSHQGPRCTNCGAGMKPGAVLCVQCGMNLQTGQRFESQVQAEAEGAEGHDAVAREVMARAEKAIAETPISAVGTDYGDSPIAYIVAIAFSLGVSGVIAGGWLLLQYMETSPFSRTGIATILLLIAIPFGSAAKIWILVIAFRENVLQGVGALLCDLYLLIYGFTRWGSCAAPMKLAFVSFFFQFIAGVLFGLGDAETNDQGRAPRPTAAPVAVVCYLPDASPRGFREFLTKSRFSRRFLLYRERPTDDPRWDDPFAPRASVAAFQSSAGRDNRAGKTLPIATIAAGFPAKFGIDVVAHAG